jgi:hypothetical protein
MSLDEDLRTEIMACSTTLGGRVHQNIVPEHQGNVFPRCWYQRLRRQDDLDLDGTRGESSESEYTVECQSVTLSEAIAAADAIRTALNGKRGTFGSMSVKGVFVEDQDDSYEPRGIGADEWAHVSALRVRIFST